MDPESRYLAVDIATHTGYALVQNGRFINAGVRDFKILPGQHKGHQGLAFWQFLRSFKRIDQIFYEEIMFSGSVKDKDGKPVQTTNDGRETYLGLKRVLYMFAAQYEVPLASIWPGTLKKQFAGSGRAEKPDMCRAARELGWKGSVDATGAFHDEADAIGIMAVKYRESYGVTPTF